MFTNPSLDQIHTRLREIHTIAVVGISSQPNRPSHRVSAAMQTYGFRIIPVRPGGGEILGETVYGSLDEIQGPIDLVDVFRAPEHVPAIVDDTISLEIPAIWLQEGVIHAESAQRASDANIFTVMDRCIYRDYVELFR
ncbi:MAG: CoA-binding protein [Gammaproteobacteria bacterium]|uniref:CoA-binding protein n=1 Tax=Candidatus Thiopontia autotrophica TaxID=2841688 RepID=A0A8J6PEG4_9GAMM|nr:CoA-binding protein [Candidatus Thiopontia autotrophica]MBL6969492.1 CoA-binding protein [Gammaproteobacteria bacterium]